MAGLVTVFGGGGFLGRYVTQELMRTGVRVRVASRDARSSWFLKPLAALGQGQFVSADVRRPESVARAVAGADAVINLVGILKGDFEAFHVDGARNVAEAARAAGAERLVQVSAIGADPDSPSAYGRSKAEGEAAVREAFPSATVIRPSVLFGAEDGFLNKFAQMIQLLPVVPVLGGATKFQPAYVKDVARAVAAAALNRGHEGTTYELGGPQVMSMAELNSWIAGAIGRSPAFVELPDALGDLISRFGFLPGAPITRDQWRMLSRDNVVSPGAAGFDAFGIDPMPLGTIAPSYLVRFRKHGRFSTDPRIAA